MENNEIERSCYTCDHEYDCEWPADLVCDCWAPDLETSKLMGDDRANA